MERLTHYQKDGKVAEPYNRTQAYDFAKKLAEYEDTGLTPEEINGFKHLEVILHTAIDKLTENIKSEVIKDFAEKLKKLYEGNLLCGSKILKNDIDELVREMTEEKNHG